ncbi:MAG: hypothetical protein Ct9H90mP28_5530 [Paracoccaceae bacterium]|jgi:5-methylthioribose kinase|nr:MAG: hypothetical protein Ct9H90mP28_5530 [Paracoccaceae bacterium]|tara:strand:+ start:7351 stop:7566 length:216 start_codon:yes stop_codon:yes gene_type:complete
MSSTDLEGIKQFDDLVKELSNVAITLFDSGLDTVIETLDFTKTAVTLFQQELIDIGKGDIVFSEKYFDNIA